MDYASRIPDLPLSRLTRGGITTVISFLGADSSTKTYGNLIGKANGLREEGITCLLLLGSYRLPTATITGNIIDDIVLIEPFIGVKAAIADKYQANGNEQELAKAIADSALACFVSGKAGVTVLHVGRSQPALSHLEKIIRDYDLPKEKILPTHVNRSHNLLEEGFRYLSGGGYIDLTTIIHDINPDMELKCSRVLKRMLEMNLDVSKVSFSSDGNGRLKSRDQNGGRIGVSDPATLHREFRDAVLSEGIEIPVALSVITTNPARFFGLSRKGTIAAGMDADLTIMDETSLEIRDVIANGIIMLRDGNVVRWGEFENRPDSI